MKRNLQRRSLTPAAAAVALPVQIPEGARGRRASDDHLRKKGHTALGLDADGVNDEGLEGASIDTLLGSHGAVAKGGGYGLGTPGAGGELAEPVRRLSLDDTARSSAATPNGDLPVEARPERRGSISASIESLMQPAAASKSTTADADPAPSSSFNLVWQRRGDGNGWSMGGAASAADATAPPGAAPVGSPRTMVSAPVRVGAARTL